MFRTAVCLSFSSLRQVEYFIGKDPDELEVAYDPVDGHPTVISADIRVQTADDEYFIESRNLQATLTGLRQPR